jgi:hypothetical protein
VNESRKGSAFYVAECNVGLGLFAAERIPVGAEILRLAGPELTLSEVREKGAAAANTLQVGVNRQSLVRPECRRPRLRAAYRTQSNRTGRRDPV